MPKPPINERGQSRKSPQQNVSHQVTQSVSVAWTSPIPPPSELANYNNVIPNGAERIIALVENEQAHRIAYEKSGRMGFSTIDIGDESDATGVMLVARIVQALGFG